jgi:hypothetical protein
MAKKKRNKEQKEEKQEEEQKDDRKQEHKAEEKDEEKERIHEGSADVQPEPALTAELDQLTEEEKRKEPGGVMPGAGPDEDSEPDGHDGKDRKEDAPKDS